MTVKRVTSPRGTRAPGAGRGHEQTVRGGGACDLSERGPGLPASSGPTANELPAALGRIDDPLAARLGDHRLGADAGVLLDEDAGVAEQPRGLLRRRSDRRPRASAAVPGGAAIHAPAPGRPVVLMAPPNGTSTPRSTLGTTGSPSRATSTATRTPPRPVLLPLHRAVPFAERRPTRPSRSSRSALGLREPGESAPRFADERHAPRSDALLHQPEPRRRSRSVASRSNLFSVWRAPRTSALREQARSRAMIQLARRLEVRERLGRRRELRNGGVVLRRHQDQAFRHRRLRENSALDSARLDQLLLDREAVLRVSGFSSVPVRKVVHSAMITSDANRRLRDHAGLERVEHDQLGQAARVHQRADHRRLAPAEPALKRASIAPDELADDRPPR